MVVVAAIIVIKLKRKGLKMRHYSGMITLEKWWKKIQTQHLYPKTHALSCTDQPPDVRFVCSEDQLVVLDGLQPLS